MSKPKILVARRVFDEVIDGLSQHFEVDAHRGDNPLSKPELAARMADKWGAFTTGSERIDAELLSAAPQLKIVANMAVGFNNFDVAACTQAGVVCTNTPDVLSETTADMAFALLMAAARRVSESEAFLRAGRWKQWSYDMFMGADIHGTTLGILGMGRIGQAVARRGALGFGMKVKYHNRSRVAPDIEQSLGAQWLGLDELLQSVDHLVIVLPYSQAAHHIIGAAQLARMKPSATLVNIGRGGLVDENALADALQAGRLLAAGLDVFEGEPAINPRLLECQNIVLTPHIGSATRPTRLGMAQLAADNLIAFHQTGKAKTRIN
jgi:glyoxylate/hydroxypyruvate/2-ketogluconate reductase